MDSPEDIKRDSHICSGHAVRLGDKGYVVVQTETLCLMCGVKDSFSIELQPCFNPVLGRRIIFSVCPACAAKTTTESQVRWGKK